MSLILMYLFITLIFKTANPFFLVRKHLNEMPREIRVAIKMFMNKTCESNAGVSNITLSGHVHFKNTRLVTK